MAVTDDIDSHITTVSYFSVVDLDEIILDEEDINPFIHVNIYEGHQNIQQGASPYLQQ